MIDTIKNLRTHIDGLAKLCNSVNSFYTYPTSEIPEGLTIEEFYKKIKEIPLESTKQTYPSITYYHSGNDKAEESLLLAKAWLGKILQELGTENPYGSGYKTVEDIVPTQDTARFTHGMRSPFGEITTSQDTFKMNGKDMSSWVNMNLIEKLDWLRTEIQKIIDDTSDFSQTHPIIELEQGFVYKYLCEARFHLGFQLQKIKENGH